MTAAPRTVTVGSRTADRHALLFPGIHSCIDPHEVHRATALAAVWDTRLTLVDTPGYGLDGAGLTPADRRAVLCGDFTSVARRMVDAALPGLSPDTPLILAGYSLGCSIAACAAGDDRLPVTRLVLVEPAALTRRGPVGLAVLARLEEVGAPTPEPGPTVPHRRLDLALLGLGLSHGRLPATVQRVALRRGFPVDLVHAAGSRITGSRDVERARRRWSAAGVPVSVTTVPGRHGMWNDADLRATAGAAVRRRWDDR